MRRIGYYYSQRDGSSTLQDISTAGVTGIEFEVISPSLVLPNGLCRRRHSRMVGLKRGQRLATSPSLSSSPCWCCSAKHSKNTGTLAIGSEHRIFERNTRSLCNLTAGGHQILYFGESNLYHLRDYSFATCNGLYLEHGLFRLKQMLVLQGHTLSLISSYPAAEEAHKAKQRHQNASAGHVQYIHKEIRLFWPIPNRVVQVTRQRKQFSGSSTNNKKQARYGRVMGSTFFSFQRFDMANLDLPEHVFLHTAPAQRRQWR